MTDHAVVSIKNHVEYSHASIVSKTIIIDLLVNGSLKRKAGDMDTKYIPKGIL